LKIEPLAVTYSRALMELAAAHDRVRPVLEDVRILAGLFRENRDFRIVIESPGIDAAEKRTVFEKVFRGRFDDLVVNFLGLIVGKKRQFLLPEIFEECEILHDQVMGRARVEATTAVPLDEAQEKEIKGILEEKLKKTVLLENKVRPDVLGGLIIRHGDEVADASVRTALARIAERLESTKIGSEIVHENQP
jgi:F-type H+-transporting ATPase subunit delta